MLLGALTVAVTPLLIFALSRLLFLRFLRTSALELLAHVFQLQDMAGFFMATALLMALCWLLGSASTAFISWRAYRSKRLAALTLAVGLCLQLGLTVFKIYSITSNGDETAGLDAAFKTVESSFERYAALSPPEVSVRERHDDWGDDFPEFGPYFAHLEVAVPITVHRPGTYRFYVEYKPMLKSIYPTDLQLTRTLLAGRDTVLVAFQPGMYRSPAYTGGLASVKAYCLVSPGEILDLAMPTLHLSRGRLRELESTWNKDSAMVPAVEEFVDSAGTAYPQNVERRHR